MTYVEKQANIEWLHYFGTVCSIMIAINNEGKPTWQHKIVKQKNRSAGLRAMSS